jgi:hypothetical protein
LLDTVPPSEMASYSVCSQEEVENRSKLAQASSKKYVELFAVHSPRYEVLLEISLSKRKITCNLDYTIV